MAPSSTPGAARTAWIVTLAAAAFIMVTQGTRQAMGMFVSPLNTSTALGITTISLALAIGQFVWGAVQPFAGALADRFGAAGVLYGGVLLLVLGFGLTPFMTSGFGLIVSLGLITAMGAGAGSFSVLLGAVASHVAPEKRGKAAGIINAGASVGQFVFAPLAQRLIQMFGWMSAMWTLAALSLAVLPLIRTVSRKAPALPTATATKAAPMQAVREAMGDRSYLLLHAGFFTCGFHVAFLVTHLPGEVDLCGLPPSVAGWSLAIIGLANIAGSLIAGSATQHFRSKYILAAMYGSRVLLIAWYLAAPKTEGTFYVFAVGLGLTWLSTVSPTAAIVGKLFGIRYLATLFGLTLLSHQIGAFFGAWLGGIALVATGTYQWMWYADMALAAAAALLNLPIREARIVPAPVSA